MLKHKSTIELMQKRERQTVVAPFLNAQAGQVDHLDFGADRIGYKVNANLT